MNHQKKVCIETLHTINNDDSSLAVHPKPVSHCESPPRNHPNRSEKPLPRRKTEKYRQRKTKKHKEHRGRCRDEEKNGDNREQHKERKSHREEKLRERERQNLPQAVLPVHSHIHLIHPTLRNSTCWNQQTHACRREDRGRRMDGGRNNEIHHWIY